MRRHQQPGSASLATLIGALLFGLAGPAVARTAAQPAAPAPPKNGTAPVVAPPPSAPPAPAPAAKEAPAPSSAPAPLQGNPRTRPAGPRVAIVDMAVEGDGAAPAITMRLQDGFVLGLVRAGIDVIDSVDVDKRLSASPELKGCESSPCLKKAGELLAARYALRVKVGLTGNSYRMSARLFSTEGAVPAALPIATLSRTCDVCTVEEARETMIKLADGMRARIEAETAAQAPAVPSTAPPSRVGPLLALGAGVLAVAAGAALISAAGADGKNQAAAGGALLGAGLTTSGVALFLVLRSSDPNAPPKTAFIGARWAF